MDLQIAFNIAIGLVSMLGGYVLKSISDNMKSLQATDIQLAEKVQRIEVLVSGQYVTRAEIDKLSNALFTKLDRIFDRLDGKQDKL